MSRIRDAVLLAAAVSALAPSAEAIPAFARRYGTDCSYCHRVFPKLTYEGQRFKERGFRLAGESGFEPGEWIRSVPLTGRGSANQLLLEDADDFTSGYLKTISAGNLGKRLSYWVDDAFLITEGDDGFQHLKPENAWGRVELLSDERLYLKAGRFELAIPFTQARTPHLFSYDAFTTNLGFENDGVAVYQDGAELGGSFRGDWRWSAALVKGRNSKQAEAFSSAVGKFDANVFLRLSRRVGNHRFGGFAYFGSGTLARSPSIVFQNRLQRLGVDADVWIAKLNLYGAFVHGRDSNPFASGARPQGTKLAQTLDGGFAQADWHATDALVLTARLNVVRRPVDRSGGASRTFSSLFPGAQLWLFKHGKLSFEYGFRNQKQSSLGAIQAEIVF